MVAINSRGLTMLEGPNLEREGMNGYGPIRRFSSKFHQLALWRVAVVTNSLSSELPKIRGEPHKEAIVDFQNRLRSGSERVLWTLDGGLDVLETQCS